MTSLHDLQRAMRASILAGDDAIASLVPADGLTAEGRLRIYRNNTFISLTEALEATFPVVCRLVDERFFGYAADAYIRDFPPTRPCLAEYGADFPDFLAGFAPARTLTYLPDVARLEWALNCAYHAPDATALDPRHLAAIPQSRYAELRFALHPSCRLVESAFPVDRIWEANQPESDGKLDIDLATGCRLLVHRQGLEARFARLDAANLAFVRALEDGAALERAYAAAISIDAAFDATAALGDCFARALFTEAIQSAPAG